MNKNTTTTSMALIGKIFLIIFTCIFFLSSNVSAQKKALKPQAAKVLYGQASFYANKFDGRRTASGETFNQKKFTCACNALPLGTLIKVTNLSNNKSVIVKVNDRIHPKVRRVVDLTRAAAIKLGFVSSGLTRVKVEVLSKRKKIKT